MSDEQIQVNPSFKELVWTSSSPEGVHALVATEKNECVKLLANNDGTFYIAQPATSTRSILLRGEVGVLNHYKTKLERAQLYVYRAWREGMNQGRL